MNWKVEYKGTEITKYIDSVSVNGSEDSFCYEYQINFGAHCTELDAHDWSSILSEPDIEIFLDDGSGFVSLGSFFVERPNYVFGRNVSKLSGIWGRSVHAVLSNPFSYIITGIFDTDTDVDSIISFIIDNYSRGLLSYESSHNLISNYPIGPDEYSFDQLYPIDVLIDFVSKIGGVVVPMTDGTFRIRRPDKQDFVGTATHSFSNSDIVEISMAVNVPDFGNRVKVLGTASGSELSFNFITGPVCWSKGQLDVIVVTSGEDTPLMPKDIVGQVLDKDSVPINGIEIMWYLKDTDYYTVNEFAELEDSVTVTGLEENMFEIVQTSNFKNITLKYHPSKIKSIIYYYSVGNSKDYSEGAEIEGSSITLAENAPYCDATMYVLYDADGITKNTVSPRGKTGSTKIVAEIFLPGAETDEESEKFEEWLHFNNPCACATTVEWMPRGSLKIAGSAAEMEEVTTTYTDYEQVAVDNTYTTEQQTATRTTQVTPTNCEKGVTCDFNVALGVPKLLSISECVTVDHSTVAMLGVGGNISGGQSVGYEEYRNPYASDDGYMSDQLWVDLHFYQEYSSEGHLLNKVVPVQITYEYETSPETETTETTYEYVEVERESTSYYSSSVTAEKQPLYCAVKMQDEAVYGETINFSIVEGGEYATIGVATFSFSATFFGIDEEEGVLGSGTINSSSGSSCSAETKSMSIIEATEVKQLNQDGRLGVFLKNEVANEAAGLIYEGDGSGVPDLFDGVYLIVDGAVDYSVNYFETLGRDRRTAFIWGGLEEGQEVAAVYYTHCAMIYLIPGDITGETQVSVTIKASIESMMQDPIESEMTFTLVNTALEQLEEQLDAMEG